MGQAVSGVAPGRGTVEAQLGQGVEDPVVTGAGVGLGAHHCDCLVAPAVPGQEPHEFAGRVRVALTADAWANLTAREYL
jgi:hypothetical protein